MVGGDGDGGRDTWATGVGRGANLGDGAGKAEEEAQAAVLPGLSRPGPSPGPQRRTLPRVLPIAASQTRVAACGRVAAGVAAHSTCGRVAVCAADGDRNPN
jgi:hypothetical protein